ncbi:NUDIX hydrolase [Bacillus sp. 123MFChir2]|uniref:NUDIX hydrolase n=1 Tax=Bacillus sp. 123MFChir2 TaxID=1169144 RepID=UPI000365D270|nr:NUDIX domain-containing protein [Bacillus sp. 123MFChir2]
MESELLKIFDQQRNPVGVATREEVHKIGHWHETFHCWFISREDGVDYIHLQIRSHTKKDYPNLLDITAAGHILAHETVYDGIREVQEEVGIEVSFDELISLDTINYCVTMEDFIDKELAHVFLYEMKGTMDDYTLQAEEVSGIVKIAFNSFAELWLGERNEITVEGFEMNEVGEKVSIHKTIDKSHFVPHELSYYESIITLMRENMKLLV